MFGTTETNLNSLGREGLSDVWQGGGKGASSPTVSALHLGKGPAPSLLRW